MTENRRRAKLALSQILKSEININIIEELIFSSYHEEEYLSIIYQSIGLLQLYNIEKVIEMIVKKQLFFDKKIYDKYYEKRRQQNEFLTKKFDVVEGAIECPKCNGKRVLSTQRQTRKSDEGFTTFNVCHQCKYKWITNN